MLRKQVAELSKLSIENHSINEKLEEFARHLYLRADGIHAVNYESSHDVMNLLKSLFKETKFSVRENGLDCAHRIGPIYIDRVSQKSVKVLL